MSALRVLLLSLAAMVAPSWSSGQSSSPPPPPATRDYSNPNVELPRAPRVWRAPADPNIRNIQSILIKWKRTARIAQAQPPTAEELLSVTQVAGVKLAVFKDHGYGSIVFQFPQPMSQDEAEEIAARIQALPEIEYAEPNWPVYLNAVPNDPLFQA
jgi:hypothetical protein